MKVQWHRDRIDELKSISSNLKWKAMGFIVAYLGIVPLIYLVWYNQDFPSIRVLLAIIFVYITYKVAKELKKTISDANEVNLRLRRNYDKLLGRKK